jgi:hypothetical protein
MKTGFDEAITAANDRGEHRLARRIMAEKKISTAIITACLKRKFNISVSDGEDWPIKSSSNKAAILATLFSTDEDIIVIRTKDGTKAGWFQLIYGNDGHDVVSDYSVTNACEEIWNDVIKPLADKLEKSAANYN